MAAKLPQHGVYQDDAVMFKITQNTTDRFSLAEILLMAAMNELEARRKASCTPSGSKGHVRLSNDC